MRVRGDRAGERVVGDGEVGRDQRAEGAAGAGPGPGTFAPLWLDALDAVTDLSAARVTA